MNSNFNKLSYTSKSHIKDIVKIKEVFPKLLVGKVNKINNVINKPSQKSKLRLNMTIKGAFKKQIIISISINNMKRVIASFNIHVTNINRLLKNIKLEISIDFIQTDNKSIIVTTNKVTVTSNLNNVNSSNIKSLKLSQLKSYLKILSILYFVKDANLLITIYTYIVERVIQTTYLFNDIVLAFCPCIIKVSPKLNIAIIWINI